MFSDKRLYNIIIALIVMILLLVLAIISSSVDLLSLTVIELIVINSVFFYSIVIMIFVIIIIIIIILLLCCQIAKILKFLDFAFNMFVLIIKKMLRVLVDEFIILLNLSVLHKRVKITLFNILDLVLSWIFLFMINIIVLINRIFDWLLVWIFYRVGIFKRKFFNIILTLRRIYIFWIKLWGLD